MLRRRRAQGTQKPLGLAWCTEGTRGPDDLVAGKENPCDPSPLQQSLVLNSGNRMQTELVLPSQREGPR